MTKYNFEVLKLNNGDYIWLVNEKGEGIFGYYRGNYNSGAQTFTFNNHSNGATEQVQILKLQRLEVRQRVS